jgi:hypothetical protein
MSHTPGPWDRHETGAIVGPKLDDKPVWLRPVIARFETGVKEADARLIAAAPELLETLENLLNEITESNSDYGVFDVAYRQILIMEARHAIAKARGQ